MKRELKEGSTKLASPDSQLEKNVFSAVKEVNNGSLHDVEGKMVSLQFYHKVKVYSVSICTHLYVVYC